jgi:uncharacterized membrane protein
MFVGSRLTRYFRRLSKRREDGSVIILASGIFALLGCCGIIATDLGMIYLDRREAQGAVDLAALSAVLDFNQADKIVDTVLADNGVPKYSALQVTTGHYDPDASLAPSARFVAGGAPVNAVHVQLRKTAPLYFGKRILSKDNVEIGVEAIATATDVAAFSIGSRLLSLNGGIANAILSDTLGTSVSLSAVDYRALAQADLDLFQTFDQLAEQGSVDAVTYQDVLDSDVPYSEFVDAMSTTVGASDEEGSATTAINRLAGSVSSVSTEINLEEIIDAGPFGAYTVGSGPAGVTTAPLLATVVAAAALANGENQVSVDIGAELPGLLSARLDLAVGERAQDSGWVTIGPDGSLVRTAQIRMGLRLTAGGSGLLDHVRIHLPIVVEVAQSQAALSNIACSGATADEVSLDVTPGIANAWIGEPSPFDLTRDSLSMRPAKLIDSAFLDIKGRSHVESANMDPQTVVFTAEDIRNRRVQTVGTTDVTRSLASALLRDLNLEVRAFGFSLDTGAPRALRDQLSAAAAPVDDILVSTFELLGLGIGEADVSVHGARCGGPGLVG